MRKHIYLFLFFLIIGIVVNAQSILVTGKVLEQNTNNPIANATIKCGNFGTSSIKDGSFRLVLNQDIVNQLGLTISCLGFETKMVKYTPDLKVYLKPSNLMLNEVIVGIDGKSILEKAIDKIEVNYPQKDFTMTGFIKMHQIAKNDTADFKFFKNEAIVKVGVTPYKKFKTDSKVTLVQNRNLLTDSLKKEENYVMFVSGYLLPTADVVHRRNYILDKSNLKKYEYFLSSMTSINNRKAYVITFNSIKKQDNEGIIYIDSATYAIVRLNTTSYNLKPSFSIPINEASSTTNYQKIKDKWYLQNVSYNGKSYHNKIYYTRFEEYHTINIDTNKLDINYNEVIQSRTEDLQINNIVAKEKWDNYQLFIDSLEGKNLVSKINPPPTPTNYVEEKTNTKSKILTGLRKYIISGGYKTTYNLSQSYLDLSGFQPLINKNVTSIANYNLSIGLHFRLYKNIYFDNMGISNYSIGRVNLNRNDYLLSYQFVFNKTHHPLTITPSFGYSKIDVGKKKEQFYYQESLLYRLGFTYEKKRQTSYSVSLTYVDPFYERNNGYNLNILKFVPSLGIVKRF